MRTPLVSVVIPTFQRGQFLGESVASALRQTLVDLEVLVVDDGSTRDNGDAVSGDPRVRRLWQPNQGAAAARNAGAAAARGRWLAFLDDDDVWLPSKLERQIALSEAAPEIGMIHSDFLVLEGARTRLGDRILPRELVPSGWVGRQLFRDNFVLTSSVLMRRDLFERLGGFDARLRRTEDYELWLRASREAQIGFVDEQLTVYRVHTGQKSNREMEKHLLLPGILEAFVRTRPEVWGEYGPDIVRDRLGGLRWTAGYANMEEGSYRVAMGQFLAAWRWRPWRLRPLVYALACGGGPRAVRLVRAVKRSVRVERAFPRG